MVLTASFMAMHAGWSLAIPTILFKPDLSISHDSSVERPLRKATVPPYEGLEICEEARIARETNVRAPTDSYAEDEPAALYPEPCCHCL
jgi:hypothetical protein